MNRLDAIQLFIRVVERGSFSAAAKEAGIGQSAASKRIASLEAALGTQLLNRSSRGLSPTEAGTAFYEGCLRITDDYLSLESAVKRGQAEPSGLLRVAVAPLFGRLYIVPHLAEFFERYPAVRVELAASERHVDLVEENIDLAIRHGSLRDSSLTVRKLADSPIVTVASRDYFARHGKPQQPSALAEHACLAFTGGGAVRPWAYIEHDGTRITHLPDGRFRASDGEQLRAALLADLGIAYVPAWMVGPEIASGVVERLSPGFGAETIAISALYSARRRPSAKISAFIDFLAATLAIDLSLAPAAAGPKNLRSRHRV